MAKGSCCDTKGKALIFQTLIVVGSIIQIGLVCICLGDGQSVITLKEDADLPTVLSLPIGANAAMVHLTIRQVLYHPYTPGHFAPYGIGADHDMWGMGHSEHSGASLKEALDAGLDTAGVLAALKTRAQFHIASFLGCHDLIDALSLAKGLCYIAVFAAFIQVVISACHLVRPDLKVLAILTPIIQFILFIGFMIALIVVSQIHTVEWECDQTLIPKVTLENHFDLAYGFSFMVDCMIVSVFQFVGSLYIFMVVSKWGLFQSVDALIEQVCFLKDAERDTCIQQVKDEADKKREEEVERIKKKKETERNKEVAEAKKVNQSEVQDIISNLTEANAKELESLTKEREQQRKAAVAKAMKEKQSSGDTNRADITSIKAEMDMIRKADLARLRDDKDMEVRNLREQLTKVQLDREDAHKTELSMVTEEKDRKIKELMGQMDGISPRQPDTDELDAQSTKGPKCCRI